MSKPKKDKDRIIIKRAHRASSRGWGLRRFAREIAQPDYDSPDERLKLAAQRWCDRKGVDW